VCGNELLVVCVSGLVPFGNKFMCAGKLLVVCGGKLVVVCGGESAERLAHKANKTTKMKIPNPIPIQAIKGSPDGSSLQT
jgi:hypothetical protein